MSIVDIAKKDRSLLPSYENAGSSFEAISIDSGDDEFNLSDIEI